MDRIIFGCSNIFRFYEGGKIGNTTYKVERTTNLVKLKDSILALNKDETNGKSMIFALLENIICDEIKKAENDHEIEDLGKNGIDKFLNVIKATQVEMPDSQFVLIKPMTRPAFKGYDKSAHVGSIL